MTSTRTPETDALLGALAQRRAFLKTTANGLTESQLREASTVSELSIAALLKHVTAVEREWTRFITDGARPEQSDVDWAALDWSNPAELPDVVRAHAEQFRVAPEVTATQLLADYDQAAAQTERVVEQLPDLDVSQELPRAPWFEPGARWSARDVLIHLIGETAQHSGHADIIREAIDGQKTMG